MADDKPGRAQRGGREFAPPAPHTRHMEPGMRRERRVIELEIEIDPGIELEPYQVHDRLLSMPAHYGWRIVGIKERPYVADLLPSERETVIEALGMYAGYHAWASVDGMDALVVGDEEATKLREVHRAKVVAAAALRDRLSARHPSDGTTTPSQGVDHG